MKSKLSRKLVNLCSVCKVWAGKGSFFFPNEQNELPKRRNEADVASQIRLQLRSEFFTQEKKLKHRALQQKRLPNEVPREAEALASQYR